MTGLNSQRNLKYSVNFITILLRVKLMRFIVDCMLGKLAKWLKILGFDALFFSKIEDDELLRLADAEGRILLTRDNGLVERAHRGGVEVLFIDSEEWRSQVGQVLDEYHLRDKSRPYSRCIECNIVLKELSKAKARNLVTPFVLEQAQAFALCPDCGRVFWKGTHHADMEDKVREILTQNSKLKA